jgi:hypothetical protein
MDVCESVRVQKSEDVSKTCADVAAETELSKAKGGETSDKAASSFYRSNKKKSETGCLLKRYEQCGGT